MLFFFSGGSAPPISHVLILFFGVLNFPAILLSRGFTAFHTGGMSMVILVQLLVWTLAFAGLFRLMRWVRLSFKRPNA